MDCHRNKEYILDLQALIEIDQQLLLLLNGSDSLFLDGMMITLTSSITWIPLYLTLVYLIIKNNETMSQIFLILGFVALCLLLSAGVADATVKPLVERLRPCNDPILKYQIDIVDTYRPRTYSFFSGHSSNTLSLALFLSLLVRSKLFTFFMIAWSLINAYTRLYLGVHYPTDIIVGFTWGAIVGYTTYFLYRKANRKLSQENNYISSQYTRTGYDFNDINIVVLVFVLTVFYAIIRGLVLYT